MVNSSQGGGTKDSLVLGTPAMRQTQSIEGMHQSQIIPEVEIRPDAGGPG